MNPNPTAPHDPRTCRLCAPFRHPSGRAARQQLASGMASSRRPMDDEVGK
ncbi:hypothetical protein ACIPQH_24875 [Streptomyces rubiginosohelvolus]